jgi:hypothetical protein
MMTLEYSGKHGVPEQLFRIWAKYHNKPTMTAGGDRFRRREGMTECVLFVDGGSRDSQIGSEIMPSLSFQLREQMFRSVLVVNRI